MAKDYFFKALTRKTIRIEANNLDQAKQFFLENNVAINVLDRKERE